MKSNITSLNIKSYDTSLVKKITDAIAKGKDGKPLIDVIFSPLDLVYVNAKKRGKALHGMDGQSIRFPLININRGSTISLSEMTGAVSGHRRNTYSVAYEDYGKVHGSAYQALKYNIPYQIDIFGEDESDTLILTQEILFLLYRDPYIKVYKYEDSDISSIKDRETKVGISMDPSIQDNSALEQEEDIGKIYRYTINLIVNDAVLTRDKPIHLILDHDIEIEIQEK